MLQDEVVVNEDDTFPTSVRNQLEASSSSSSSSKRSFADGLFKRIESAKRTKTNAASNDKSEAVSSESDSDDED